jgi:formylmethanofuran dehydrogenase subunit E
VQNDKGDSDSDVKTLREIPCVKCGKVAQIREIVVTEEGPVCKDCRRGSQPD